MGNSISSMRCPFSRTCLKRFSSLVMKEMLRIISPGGYLLITAHGDWYLDQLISDEQEQFQAGRLVTRSAWAAGTNHCTAFHPVKYVREKLAQPFSVIDFIPLGAKGNPQQDVFLPKKPAKVT